jgi:hypothetical protein
MTQKRDYCSRLGLLIILLLGVICGQLSMSLVIKYSPYWQRAKECAEASAGAAK